MKTPLLLVAAFVLSPLPPLLAKDDIANATKTSRRAWENAPAEKKNAWQQQFKALRAIDISEQTDRQVVLARGNAEEYHAHPTTVLLPDQKTMMCVWNIGHGGHAGPVARSEDAGIHWKRVDALFPRNYVNFRNCPSIYRIADSSGKERLWIFAASTLVQKPEEFPSRLKGWMPRVVSEDNGQSWREEPPLGPVSAEAPSAEWLASPFRNVMTFSSMVPLKDGSTLGLFHRGAYGKDADLQVLQSVTRDGGFTWSEPVMVCDGTQLHGKDPCEPYVFRSPDGNELCCIMRENRRSGTSLMMFSSDEGKTWSAPTDTPWGLTGDRHHGVFLADGRMVVVFRNTTPEVAPPSSPKEAGLIAWVGRYEDLHKGLPGQYRVGLLRSTKDGFYQGIHLLPDGTLVATTYATLQKEDKGCSIVSVRFKMEEIDAMAAAQNK